MTSIRALARSTHTTTAGTAGRPPSAEGFDSDSKPLGSRTRSGKFVSAATRTTMSGSRRVRCTLRQECKRFWPCPSVETAGRHILRPAVPFRDGCPSRSESPAPLTVFIHIDSILSLVEREIRRRITPRGTLHEPTRTLASPVLPGHSGTRLARTVASTVCASTYTRMAIR